MSFEQGLGKTRTAIALFLALHKKRVLIICPKSLLFSWKSELEKLGETDVSILSETSVIAKWNIINYDRLSSLSTSLTQTIDGIIVDETQYIIHLSAQRTKRVIELCKTSPNVKDILLLSGTPIKKD
jgi:SNF2 family DNA or RNA helicase